MTTTTEVAEFPMLVVLAVNVRHYRDQAALTQGDLEYLAKVGRNTIVKMEGATGSRSGGLQTHVIEKVSLALGVPWMDLLSVHPGLREEYAARTRVYLQGRISSVDVDIDEPEQLSLHPPATLVPVANSA